MTLTRFNRHFSTTKELCRRKHRIVRPRFRHLPPRRDYTFTKGRSHEFMSMMRHNKHLFPPAESQKPTEVSVFEQYSDPDYLDRIFEKNDRNLLPEVKIFFDKDNELFLALHPWDRKVVTKTKLGIDNNLPEQKIPNLMARYKELSFSDSNTITQIKYLQDNDPDFVWTPADLSKQFKVTEDSILKVCPPTHKQLRMETVISSVYKDLDSRSKERFYALREKIRFKMVKRMLFFKFIPPN